MCFRCALCRVLAALGIALLVSGTPYPVKAQKGCMSFGQARSLGLFAKYRLRPAAQIKNNVEARTGGKVVSFLVCRSGAGPFYQLTVVTSDGNVQNIRVPAQ